MNTGSSVIYAVINSKITIFNTKGIKMKRAVDAQFEVVGDIEISILLSNLLDNAIAGRDTSEPQIELIIGNKKSLMYIAVKTE